MRSRPPGIAQRALVVAIGLACALSFALADGARTGGLPAFPGAEGFGADTPGGRGGDVIEVTNLNDSGPGSLREAMEVRTGPRIVVVKVGGTILLSRNIQVREANSYLTVAGQKAPGAGIQLKNFGIEFRDGAHDVVLRYLRSRPGDTTPGIWDKDAILLYGNNGIPVHDIVVDHVSAEWAIDENVDMTGPVQNATIQWSLIAEGSLTGHPKGPHSMGLLVDAGLGSTVSVHHCLLAHNGDRNPLLQDNAEGAVDFRSNVVYNWQNNNAGDTKNGTRTNYVANLYLKGPSSSTIEDSVFNVPDRTNETGVQLYVWGNRGPRCPTGCPADEWAIGVWFWENSTHYDADPALYRVYRPWPVPPVTTQAVDVMKELVLATAGASLPVRDPVDRRIVEDVLNGTGAVGINSGYPALPPGSWPADSDHDGMPDVWESAYGLDPHDPADARGDLNADGYTNVEEFLNDRDPTAPPVPAGAGTVPDGASVPGVQLGVAKGAGEHIVLSWAPSCQAADDDFEIYEGDLGVGYDYRPLFCSTGGVTTLTVTPSADTVYFLVVPRRGTREGSYGRDSAGNERPAAAAPCAPRAIAGCP